MKLTSLFSALLLAGLAATSHAADTNVTTNTNNALATATPAPILSAARDIACPRWQCGYNTDSVGTVSFDMDMVISAQDSTADNHLTPENTNMTSSVKGGGYDCPRWSCGYNTDSVGAVSFDMDTAINAQDTTDNNRLTPETTTMESFAPSYECPRWRCGYNTNSVGAVSFNMDSEPDVAVNSKVNEANTADLTTVQTLGVSENCLRWRCGYNTDNIGAVSFEMNLEPSVQ